MASLSIENVKKSFGATPILHGVSIHIPDGAFVILVGPSGCGKSTLLRMIAGLEEITAGEIRIGSRVVNGVAPKERDIAMVFQSYALYPHMTVEQNMAFSLKLKAAPRQEINAKVARAADILGLQELLQRYPKELSGGQRQRVAMGRAIVRDPSVFLFDEPLSNLDAALRVSTRVEIAKLHRLLGATMIYVTHDQTEAMTLADRIVVMSQGEIAQVGRPLDLYYEPANLFVAGFIGSPAMNFFEARAETSSRLSGPAFDAFDLPGFRFAPGASVKLGLRPEHMRLGAGDGLALPASVELIERLGEISYAHTRGRVGQTIVAETRGREAPAIGDAVTFGADARDLHVFDADGRRLNPSA
ncbi:MAG: ABC transporter ATP-binding protein [Roseiarcus sp.]